MKCLYVVLLLPTVTCFFGSIHPDSEFTTPSDSGNSTDFRSPITGGWQPVIPGHTTFPWPSPSLQILTNFTLSPSASEIILTVTTIEEKSLKLNLSISRGELSLPECGYGPENQKISTKLHQLQLRKTGDIYSDISQNPGKDGLVVWTINKANNDLTLLKDGVTQAIVDISDCSWSERLQSVTFDKNDTASLKYRTKPESCQGDLPPHISLSSDSFPVSDGDKVSVSCRDEDLTMNIGSDSMICDTNVYGDWRVKGGEAKPWCLGVKMMNGEGVTGVTESVTIGCALSHYPPHTTIKAAEMEWRMDDGSAVEGTIVTNSSDTSITSNLTLPSLPNSVGEHTYTCSPKTQPTWKGSVSVRVFRVTTVSKDSAIGKSATLSCNVINTPQHSKVTWWFGDKEVTKGVTTSTPETGSLFSSLTVSTTQIDLNFTCNVQTPRSTYTFPVELDTYEVLGVLLDICAAECRVQGVRSAMDISWHLNGQPHSDTVISEPDGSGMQRSVALKLHNPGVYTCVVRSRVRPSSEPLEVDVTVPDPAPSPTMGPITWILVAMVFILLSVICGGVLFMVRQKKRVHRLSMRVTSRKYLESVGDIPSIYRQRCSSGTSFSRRDSMSNGKRLSAQMSVPAMSELDRSLTISRTEEEEEGEE